MKWEIEISDSIEERIETCGYDSLTSAEKEYHAVWWFLFVVYGPGLIAYFDEVPDCQIELAIDGLRAIGAVEMSEHLSDAMAKLPQNYEKGQLFDSLGEEGEDRIIEISDRITDRKSPHAALKKYAKMNDEELIGPRTQLELWKSKYKRGVDMTPRYVDGPPNFDIEAEKDQKYSTRSCPICDYPTPNYRPTCKRCDYPHGRAPMPS